MGRFYSAGYDYARLTQRMPPEWHTVSRANNYAFETPHGPRHVSRFIRPGDSVLDYGCGRSTCMEELPIRLMKFDPFIPKYAEVPQQADVVVCYNVFNVVEPEFLSPLFNELRRLARRTVVIQAIEPGFFRIKAEEYLSLAGGLRASHVISQPMPWCSFPRRLVYLLLD